MTQAERNYDVYDRKLMGVIRGLNEWSHLLIGSPHPVTIYSDHKNLTYWKTARNLNRCQAQWALRLSEFDYWLVHVPGSQMVQSDALSRWPDHDNGSSDNTDVTILPDHLWVAAVNVDLRTAILTAGTDDSLYVEGLRNAQEGLTEHWTLLDRCYRGCAR